MTVQDDIRAELDVSDDFDAATEAERRMAFLADYLTAARARGYVLGISGGVDSTTAGRLTKLACDRTGTTFHAVRLPYGTQADEPDAQAALQFIDPHTTTTVDIQPATDALMAGLNGDARAALDADRARADFVRGNVKARQRMVVQYALAGATGSLVVGTDHAAEAVMGFFTKYGDGACDITPLAGLTKRRVRAIAAHLGAPQRLITKTPTADLEDDRPGLPDEEAYGVTYDQIDTYLEGGTVDDRARRIIETAHASTAHKRALPAAPVSGDR